MSADPQTNEANRTPSEIQQAVNPVSYFGITEDFEGWFLKGKYTYIWKLKRVPPSGLGPLREAEDEYEKMQAAGFKGLVTSQEVDDASDKLARKIFDFGLQDFTDEDWQALFNDPDLSRGDLSDCATGLYLFLMRIMTKRAAMRLLKPQPKGTPNISDIRRDWRKSGS